MSLSANVQPHLNVVAHFLETEDDTFGYSLRLFWSNNEADCLATLLLILAFLANYCGHDR